MYLDKAFLGLLGSFAFFSFLTLFTGGNLVAGAEGGWRGAGAADGAAAGSGAATVLPFAFLGDLAILLGLLGCCNPELAVGYGMMGAGRGDCTALLKVGQPL